MLLAVAVAFAFANDDVEVLVADNKTDEFLVTLLADVAIIAKDLATLLSFDATTDELALMVVEEFPTTEHSALLSTEISFVGIVDLLVAETDNFVSLLHLLDIPITLLVWVVVLFLLDVASPLLVIVFLSLLISVVVLFFYRLFYYTYAVLWNIFFL